MSVDWTKIDWTKSNAKIAKEVGRTRERVRQARERYGEPLPPDADESTLAGRIRSRRMAAGLTSLELDAAAGIRRRSLEWIEQGTRPTDPKVLPRIAAALHTTVEDLVGLPERPLPEMLATLRQRHGAREFRRALEELG